MLYTVKNLKEMTKECVAKHLHSMLIMTMQFSRYLILELNPSYYQLYYPFSKIAKGIWLAEELKEVSFSHVGYQ